MSDYTITTNFGAKDSLPSGNAGKVIKGSEFTTEFTNIQTAITTKADTAGDTFTGVVNFSADVAVNTNTLFVDVSEAKVGIGTSSPDQKLQVDGNIRLGDTATGVDDDEDYGLRTGGSLTLHANDSGNNTFNTALAFDVGNASGAQAASSKIQFKVNNTERMLIDSSGNVGIGTTSPAANLHVDASAPEFRLSQSGTVKVRLRTAGDNYINTGQNLGIGTTSPSAKLEVSATAPTYTNLGTVLWGGTTNNDNHTGISLSSSGDALGGSVGSNLYYSNSSTATQSNTNRSSGEIKIDNTTSTGTSTIRLGGYVKGTTTFDEHMRIDSSGKLLLNTSTHTLTDSEMVVASEYSASGTTTGGITLSSRQSGSWRNSGIFANGDDLTFTTGDTGLNGAQASSERMRIDSSGNVGIGTTNPHSLLHVDGGDVKISSDSATSNGDGKPAIFFSESTADEVFGQISYHGDDETDDNNFIGIGCAGSTATTQALMKEIHQMVVTAGGKVGIGTTIPASEVDISKASGGDSALSLTSAGVQRHQIIQKGTGDGSLVFYNQTASTERMRIDASGNVLVGTTTQFGTDGISLNQSGWFYVRRTSDKAATLRRDGTDGDIITFDKAGTTVGSISVTGSATSYNTSSDERLKENIADSADAGSKVDAIQIRQFDWKADGSHQDYGVIAQELVEVAPEAVHQPVDEEDMMGVDYSKLVPMLIKEVQSLRSRVAELENT